MDPYIDMRKQLANMRGLKHKSNKHFLKEETIKISDTEQESQLSKIRDSVDPSVVLEPIVVSEESVTSTGEVLGSIVFIMIVDKNQNNSKLTIQPSETAAGGNSIELNNEIVEVVNDLKNYFDSDFVPYWIENQLT